MAGCSLISAATKPPNFAPIAHRHDQRNRSNRKQVQPPHGVPEFGRHFSTIEYTRQGRVAFPKARQFLKHRLRSELQWAMNSGRPTLATNGYVTAVNLDKVMRCVLVG
jgi:hypothetical protein